MDRDITILTGAAGFLGSAIAVDLSRDRQIIAVDRRKPVEDLVRATKGALWHQTDISDKSAVQALFRETVERFGRVDFVLHFAAFHDFGTRWWPEYERTNIGGTTLLLHCAMHANVKRFVFASSVAAMQPPPPGGVLTETTPTSDYIPYAKSKAIGETRVLEISQHMPVVILRIGGVFSDWCELPPLSSILRMWTGRFPMNRFLVGRGTSGFPYIHRADLVTLVRLCLDKHEQLDAAEVLLGCQNGAVSHRDLWAAVWSARNTALREPLFVPSGVAGIGVTLRYALGGLIGRTPYERPWMMRYVDRPWVVDTTYTRRKLGWDCTAAMGILERVPILLERQRQRRHDWIVRNDPQNRQRYAYESSET
jgi:nucleoside-diphosphate-sugar epimerase